MISHRQLGLPLGLAPSTGSAVALPKEIRQFLDHCRVRQLSPNTVRAYKADLADLVAFLGPTFHLSAFDQHGLRRYIDYLTIDRRRRATTVRRRLATVPLLIIDDLGMRKLPHTAAEDLLEVIMRRYERASTVFTSNRPVEDWGKLLGDTAAVTALLDRLAPSRACAQVRTEELADEGPDRLAPRGADEVTPAVSVARRGRRF